MPVLPPLHSLRARIGLLLTVSITVVVGLAIGLFWLLLETDGISAPTLVLLSAILSMALVVPLGMVAAERWISRPLARLIAVIRAIQHGAYRDADYRSSGGEFGSVLEAIRDMAVTLDRRESEARLWAAVLENTREAIFITDACGRTVFVNRAYGEITGYGVQEALGVPPDVVARNDGGSLLGQLAGDLAQAGHWTGEVRGLRKQGGDYPAWLSMTAIRDDRGGTSHYVGIFTDTSERKAQDERIQYLAHHDVLTGLPNRVLLQDRLAVATAQADREGHQVGLLFIDLDRFKYINDTLGHRMGDKLLRAVSERIKSSVRASDTVSRQGGDEFIVLLTKIRKPEDAAHVAEHIVAMLAPSFTIEGTELSISPSIGVSVYPRDAKDADTLVKHADVAMYHAKNQGRNNFQFFAPEMNAEAFERMSLEHGLRLAVDRDEFVLHYQPQIDIASRRLVGVEALVRWMSPEYGMVPPGRFIPVAEESGLILQVGNWVLHEACRQRAEWTRAGLPSFPVAVNVSALQFRQADFHSRVEDALRIYGVSGRDIELELTESIVMFEAENTARTMAHLRQLEVSLAIDDFGTGYSSLGYLKRLPIDKLKIDQSFVRDLETDPADRAIVEAIISMGRALDLRLVAEGVECLKILGLLGAQGCHIAQGYYYCKPMAADELVRWLAEFERCARDCEGLEYAQCI